MSSGRRCSPTSWPTCGGATRGCGGWSCWYWACTGGTRSSGGRGARSRRPRSSAATPGSSGPCRRQPTPAADVTAAGAAAPDTAKTDRSAEPVHQGMERGHDPQDVEEAKDEADLLKAQLEGKKAELQEAQVLLEKARRQLQRLEALGRRGAVAGNAPPSSSRRATWTRRARMWRCGRR